MYSQFLRILKTCSDYYIALEHCFTLFETLQKLEHYNLNFNETFIKLLGKFEFISLKFNKENNTLIKETKRYLHNKLNN